MSADGDRGLGVEAQGQITRDGWLAGLRPNIVEFDPLGCWRCGQAQINGSEGGHKL
jgi:hypothetical protein